MTEQVSFPLLFHFNQPLPDGVEAVQLLGGKGAGLVEMTGRLGLAVPPGFTITTAVCREYLAHGWPHALDAALAGGLARLGEQTGGRLGDAAAPLLVSVRSGAPRSSPSRRPSWSRPPHRRRCWPIQAHRR